MLEILLRLLFIASAVDPDNYTDASIKYSPPLRTMALNYLIKEQIINPSDANIWLTNKKIYDYDNDGELITHPTAIYRILELVTQINRINSMPKIYDVNIFMQKGYTVDGIRGIQEFVRAHNTWLRAQKDFHFRYADQIQDDIDKNSKSMSTYTLLLVVLNIDRQKCPTYCRDSLNTLREKLGYEDFYKGNMPPIVSLDLYSEIP